MKPACSMWVVRLGAFLGGTSMATLAGANGEAEYVAPIDVPVSSAPGRPLPFPVVEEAQPRGTPSNATEPLPEDFVWLDVKAFEQPSPQQNGVGGKSECFQSIVLRQARIEPGKILIPAGGLGYVTETWPAALPLRQDVICIAGTPNVLVDLEQSIVTRKNVTLVPGDGAVLGSEVFRLRAITEFGDARSAVVEISSLSGFDWARLGTGSLEVSTTEPGWHAKTFHYGLHQGRVEEVTPKSVRFAWLSGLRTESIVLAEKREFADLVGGATDIALSSGQNLRVTRINGPAKQIELQTPDGSKVLNANVDLRGLPADTAVRKKLVTIGSNYAALLVPDASDFGAGKARIEVYTGIRTLKHGESAPNAGAWKAYPMAHYTGAVVGAYWVNAQSLELTPSNPTLSGPSDAFRLTTTWTKGGELVGVQLQDKAGSSGIPALAAGQKVLNALGGNGPTLHSILARVGGNVAHELRERMAQRPVEPAAKTPLESRTSAPTEARQAEPNDSGRGPNRFRVTLAASLAGLFVGILLGFVLGRARPRAKTARRTD